MNYIAFIKDVGCTFRPDASNTWAHGIDKKMGGSSMSKASVIWSMQSSLTERVSTQGSLIRNEQSCPLFSDNSRG